MLIEQWHPVTSDFGLIQAPIDVIVEEYVDWHRSLGVDLKRRQITASASDAFKSLLPFSASPCRTLFLNTTSNWVALYQNGLENSPPTLAMSHLANKLNVLTMRVCSTQAPKSANIWEVYAPGSTLPPSDCNLRRYIAAFREGSRWIFEQTGVPFDFERLSTYENSRKKDRFNRVLLCEYLSHFDIRPFSDEFLRVSKDAPAVLLDGERPSLL